MWERVKVKHLPFISVSCSLTVIGIIRGEILVLIQHNGMGLLRKSNVQYPNFLLICLFVSMVFYTAFFKYFSYITAVPGKPERQGGKPLLPFLKALVCPTRDQTLDSRSKASCSNHFNTETVFPY